jgi:hypothetical protein
MKCRAREGVSCAIARLSFLSHVARGGREPSNYESSLANLKYASVAWPLAPTAASLTRIGSRQIRRFREKLASMPELDAERIAALCRAFFEPRVMLTAAELDLFTILSGKWLSAEAVATPRGWDARALRILLDALVVMGMLSKRNNTYTATSRTADYLSSEGSFSVLDQALRAVDLWNDWSRLTARVIGTGTAPKRNSIRATVETANLMTSRIAPGIAALVRPESARRFVDVGGGAGAYTIAFLRRDRSLKAIVFDHPEVLRVCAEHIREAEM